MLDKQLPVGVFDSGLGGLSAVREIKKLLPDEDIIYFGDTGRLPYGTRSEKIICDYAADDMTFLSSFRVKAVCVACGTVSSIALPSLRERFSLPLIGVVEPAARQAAAWTKKKRVGVLATPSTIASGAFRKAVRDADEEIEVRGIGCPMFVPLVENGYIAADDPVTNIIAREYVSKLADFSPDVIILGCTHYPLIRPIIEKAADGIIGGVRTVDAGAAAAAALDAYLAENGLKREGHTGKTSFYVSDDPAGFENLASRFLGEAVADATRIDIGRYRYGTERNIQ